jgi:hypothetical protein
LSVTVHLDLPAYIVGSGDKVRQPLEGGRIGMSLASWFRQAQPGGSGFFTDQHIQRMVAILAIAIIDLPDLVIFLEDLLLLTQAYLLAVSRRLGAYQLVRAVYLGKVCFLEYDHEAPIVVVAKMKGWPPCK